MSFAFLIRIVAGLAVAGVAVVTFLTVQHLRHAPLGGVFAEVIPITPELEPMTQLPEVRAEVLVADPGTKIFERAQERMAVGELDKARERLRTIVSLYPTSKAAPEARRIVGEMNLDELLAIDHSENKNRYVVVRGDSYLGIAARQETNLDLMMYLNGLTDFRSLQPGQELWVMPLNFRLLIEPGRKALSLWDGGEFVKEYPLRAVIGAPGGDLKSVVSRKLAVDGESGVGVATKAYRGATKVLSIDRMPLVITAMPESGQTEGLARGFYLSSPDMEELALLTRVGNEVEIRSTAG
jgi:hypothetical protein